MRPQFALCVIFMLAACDKATEEQRANDRVEVATANVDNTKKNQRDVAPDTTMKTPLDQGENDRDRTITADIRKSVVGDDSLSMNAKNVKIITNAGVVTLRGVVENQAERETINAVALGTSGVTHIDNQLEVKSN